MNIYINDATAHEQRAQQNAIAMERGAKVG